MNDIFHSPKSSIARAKHHIADFERQALEFFNTKPGSFIMETDFKARQKVFKYKIVKALPPDLPNIVFDAVNNLRSALDQTCFAIGVANGKSGKYAIFPFSNSPSALETRMNGWCKDLPDEIVDIIRGFKPYKGGNNLLWALNEFCNTNKHAIITPFVMNNGGVSIRNIKTSSNNFSLGADSVWNTSKNEIELFRAPLADDVKADINVTAFIAIYDVEFLRGQPADGILDAFVSMVESIIMALEAESKRLGLC